MKRILIIALTLTGLAGTTLSGLAQTPAAQTSIEERMYISTDKDNYLSGEIVWMKLITTDPTGTPLVFSKVGYVELVGESEIHARARIEILNGAGEGTMVIPANLPTGWYRLVGYTRWMRNDGPGVYFDKRVGVVNPALGEVPRGSATGPDTDPGPATRPAASASSSGAMRVAADRESYATRGEVRLDISGIPADIHTLSVSVTAADPLGGFTRPGLENWRPATATATSPAPAPGSPAKLTPEWEGPIVTGRLVSSATGESVYSPAVGPLISFPGDKINLFGGDLSPDGSIIFRTSRVTGFTEVVTSMRGSGSQPWTIDVDDPFANPAGLFRPLPTFPLTAIDRESVQDASFAMQVQYTYANDSLALEDRRAPLFTPAPRDIYIMDEWRRFATMGEVIIEFVSFAQFRRRDDGGRYLTIFDPQSSAARAGALILLDGVPIMDHDIIYNYNPLLIDRIEVYNNRYTFGDNLFIGILAIYTERNSYPELRTDPFTQISSYAAPQARRLFYAPDYSDPARTDNRLPDFRHTLYWDADVATDGNGSAGVRFHTSDLTGTWQVLVEGITAAGTPVSATCRLQVR